MTLFLIKERFSELQGGETLTLTFPRHKTITITITMTRRCDNHRRLIGEAGTQNKMLENDVEQISKANREKQS